VRVRWETMQTADAGATQRLGAAARHEGRRLGEDRPSTPDGNRTKNGATANTFQRLDAEIAKLLCEFNYGTSD
jgi:hypothetical protein